MERTLMVKIVNPHTCKAKGAMEAKLAALQGHEVTVEYSPPPVATADREEIFSHSCLVSPN